MTIGSHQRTVGKSQAHITPKGLLDAIGPFDLDPCAAIIRPWDCATINWTEIDDGLSREWPRQYFIFLNPPFDRYVVGTWMARLAAHGNGIALLHVRTEAGWFEPVWQYASGILFLADRIHFHRPNGTRQPANSGAPVCLVAFGDRAALRLRGCGIAGVFTNKWHMQSATSNARKTEHDLPLLRALQTGNPGTDSNDRHDHAR
jgi:hypothetical protein